MPNNDITSALVTYGLISSDNYDALNAWFVALMTEVQAGRGRELIGSSIVGRTFTFASPTLTIQGALDQLSRAINILSGRSRSKIIMRF